MEGASSWREGVYEGLVVGGKDRRRGSGQPDMLSNGKRSQIDHGERPAFLVGDEGVTGKAVAALLTATCYRGETGKNGYSAGNHCRPLDYIGVRYGTLQRKVQTYTYFLVSVRWGGTPSMNLRSLFSLFSSDLAIDLGTANTLVFARGKGIVVNEPSIVAINKTTGDIEAVGKEAKEMLGRTPGNIVAIRPMKDGVIADFKVTERMLGYFIQKAHGRKMLVHPRIVIGVPSEITQVEKRAVIDSAYRAKASEVHLVEQAMVAAIGAGLPITEPSGNMVVDIGGGTTDVAVVSLSGIVYSRSVRVAGNEMDDAIMQYLKRKYNLLIGERTAEQIKIAIGSAYPLDRPITMEIKGRNLIEGVPKTVAINDSEIREALSECVATIMNAIRVALERTPPELSADISDKGIVLTGGGALIKNLDRRIREETGLPVSIAEDPLASVCLGTGKMLTDFKLLRRIAIE
jgi:rod shape-determining protein MreB